MDIGPYRILRELGRGGQGTVYLGRDERGELAAVKVVHAVDRAFDRELAAARQVAEFCTARVLRADLDHDPPYVASEYIDGPALHQVAPLRGAALTRLAIGTATALTAIHRAGVVHRDFKPGNVLMGPDGPRVIDFGIARLVDLSQSQGSAGTPPYMAPEQFAGGEVGPAADVFAWGATMVFAASGRPPFGSDTLAAVAYRIIHADPDLGELPEPLRAIVLRCLAKHPAARPTARDLLLSLLGERAPAQPEAALHQGMAAATQPAAWGPGAPTAPGPGGAAVPPTPQGPGQSPHASRPPSQAPYASGPPGQNPYASGPPGQNPYASGSPGQNPYASGPPGHGPHVGGAAGQGGSAGGVSRRVVVVGGVGVLAAAVTGVLLWRGGLGQGTRANPTPGPTPPGPSTTPPRSGTPSPSATPTRSRTPPAAAQLADVMESAVGLAPLADFGFDARITQGTWHTTATGRLAYDPQISDVRMDMRVTAEHMQPALTRRVLMAENDYVGGKLVTDPAKTPIMLYARFVHVVASIANVADLARLTEGVQSKGRTYTGSLPTTKGPESLWRQISAINNDEIPEDQLARTTLSWVLKLDESNRPRSLGLSWHMLLDQGARLTSPFDVTYENWREGEIGEPG
ncbi:serine/threonine protein kinase [Nonomuraea sp. NPDC050790]|uniref:serine/threonine protein kinase n=1 Tax=Nonomuraea sp. NPDC050790 TaxID=3364371 RepID=UPI00379CD3AF